MNRFTSFFRYALLGMALAIVALGFNACSDSTGPSDPPGSSLVTFIQANPGFTNAVVFKLDTATLAGPTPYGTVTNGLVRNGNKKIDVRATDGAVLGTANVQLDSTMRAWVIFSGNSIDRDVFSVSTKRKTAGAGEAFVRVINASKNAGDIIIKLNSASGLNLTQTKLSYKGVNDYVSLAPTSATKLVVLKDDGTTSLLDIPVSFVDQASYTVIIYGSSDPAAQTEYKLNYKIVSE